MATRQSVTFDEAMMAAATVIAGLDNAAKEGKMTREQYGWARDSLTTLLRTMFQDGELTWERLVEMRTKIDLFLATHP